MSEFSLGEVKSATIGRRAVLCGVTAFALGLIAEDGANASVAASGVTQVGNKLQLTLAKNKALAKVGGVVVIDLSDGSQVGVIRTSTATTGFKALNLTCTHETFPVTQQGSKWYCSRHNATFSLAGKAQSGPVSTALYSYPVKATKTTVTIG